MTIRTQPVRMTMDEWATATMAYDSPPRDNRILPEGRASGISATVTNPFQAERLLRSQLPHIAYQLVEPALYEVMEIRLDFCVDYTDRKIVFRLTDVSRDAVRRLATSGLVQELHTVMDAYVNEQNTITTEVRIRQTTDFDYSDINSRRGEQDRRETLPPQVFRGGTLNFHTEPQPETLKVTKDAPTPAPDQLPKAREPETRFRQWSASLKGR